MIQVEMAHDDGLDIFDIVSGCFDGCGELVVLSVLSAGEDVGYGGAPFLQP